MYGRIQFSSLRLSLLRLSVFQNFLSSVSKVLLIIELSLGRMLISVLVLFACMGVLKADQSTYGSGKTTVFKIILL
jgi:hypothetical protein